jgi:hypothetical protein
MKLSLRVLLATFLLLLCACTTAPPAAKPDPAADQKAVMQRVETLKLRALMSRDLSQWKSASFSDVRNEDVRSSGTLATAFFVVTFSAENGPTLPIRLCTTWHKVNGEWLLAQSWNAVFEGG